MFWLSSTTTLLVQRGIHRGLATLKRERGWGVSLWALLGTVLLVQIFLVLCLGVQGVDRLLRTQTDLRLQIVKGATDRSVQEFLVALRQFPEVSRAEYITREQALEREHRLNPDLIAFLDRFKIENPFPDTISVTLDTLSHYDRFIENVKEQGKAIVDPTFLSQTSGQEEELRRMLTLTDAAKSLAGIVLLLTGGILLFVVIELVRRRAFLRKEEVFVERMSGAREAAVILPFATEASVLLLVAVLLSLGCILIAFTFLPAFIPALNDGAIFGPLRTEIGRTLAIYGPLLVVLELLLAPAVGVISAWLGTRGGKGSLVS